MRPRRQGAASKRRHRFVASTTRGAEPALAAELASLGIDGIEPLSGAVSFKGPLVDGYRVCLWSRVASRVLLRLSRFPCLNADDLYDGAHAIPWETHLSPRRTLAVDVVGVSETLRHSVFTARKTKDAIVDRLRDKAGQRPDVDLRDPDCRIHVYLRDDVATVSLDMCGIPLHRRGHGRMAGDAPLKENLAAALLWLADWPTAVAEGRSLVDPFCGSGTILREAVGIAAHIAPGLPRNFWGFDHWLGHDAAAWRDVRAHAREQRRDLAQVPPVFGSDWDGRVLDAARDNAQATGLAPAIKLAQRDVAELVPPAGIGPGWLVTNPPYGARMGTEAEAARVVRTLGDRLRHHFLGWRAWILVGDTRQAKALGLRPSRRLEIHNGPLDARFLDVPISDHAPDHAAPAWRE